MKGRGAHESSNAGRAERARRWSAAGATALAIALAASPDPAAARAAVPMCAGADPMTTVARDGSALESLAFDGSGRLAYDDVLSGLVRVIDRPGGEPRTLTRLTAPGGIVRTPGGRLVIAQGNTIGPLIGGASLVELDPASGARRRLASRLRGGNGVALAPDGTLYSSDVPGGVIDRVAPDGTVERGWWRSIGGPNGLAMSLDGSTLYANLASAGRLVAIDRASGVARTIARFEPAATPDGLAIDATGHLYVTLYLAGDVRRIDPATGTACTLARGLRLPTAIAIAPPGSPFGPGTAFVTTHGGIRAIPGAVAP